jgi:hypothetical protein
MPKDRPYLRLFGEITVVGLMIGSILMIGMTIRMELYCANWYPFDNETPYTPAYLIVVFFYAPLFLLVQAPRLIMYYRQENAGLIKKMRMSSTLALALYLAPIGWRIMNEADGIWLSLLTMAAAIALTLYEGFCFVKLKSVRNLSRT